MQTLGERLPSNARAQSLPPCRWAKTGVNARRSPRCQLLPRSVQGAGSLLTEGGGERKMRSSCASGNHSAEQRPRPGVGSGVRLSALVPLPSPGVPAGLGPEKWSLCFAFLPRLASRLSLLLTPSSTPTPDAPSPRPSLCPGRKGLGHPQAQLPAPPSPASAAMRQLRQRLAGRRVLAQGRCGRPLRRRPFNGRAAVGPSSRPSVSSSQETTTSSRLSCTRVPSLCLW